MLKRENIIRCHCGRPMYEWDSFYQNVGECEMCHFLGAEFAYSDDNLAHSEPTDEYHLVPTSEYSDDIPF